VSICISSQSGNVIQQTDSLSNTAAPEAHTAPRPSSHHQSTPAEVLSWLPQTATPWQQDSAIRANIHIPNVDWSRRPNPLRTPGLKADTRHVDITKPLFHSKSLVQKDSIYRPEVVSYRPGVAGDPVPYTIAGDNIITSLLLACFIFAAVAIAKSGNFLTRQFKNIFYPRRHDPDAMTETSSELRFQLFLVVQTALLFAIVFFLYVSQNMANEFDFTNYQMIGIFTAELLAYFGAKVLLQTGVQWVFFDKKKIEQWNKSYLFIISLEGMVLFPLVMLLVYFNLSINSAAIYALALVVLVKILSFYKSHRIFFPRDTLFLQTFLYFCALEIMPLGALWGVLVLTVNNLKVIY
jgi:hypothetical protein